MIFSNKLYDKHIFISHETFYTLKKELIHLEWVTIKVWLLFSNLLFNLNLKTLTLIFSLIYNFSPVFELNYE